MLNLLMTSFHMFSKIEIQKHGYTMDKIDFPDITSPVLLSCACSPNDEKVFETGWHFGAP